MIFAIYRGVEKGQDKESGRFTKGHLYVGESEMDDQEVIDVDNIRLTDDDGEKVWIKPGGGRFEYPEEVYGVIVQPLGSKTPGEVVVINDADEDGFLSIKDMGYVGSKYVQLLDSTVLRPGMMVYDRKKTRWCHVRRVDECMRICLDDEEEMRECTDFILAVSDGDVATVPLLRCLDDTGRENIRKGAVYRVIGLSDDGMLLVPDDKGNETEFEPQRFEFI